VTQPDGRTLTQFAYQAELDGIAAAMPGPVLQIGARSQVIDQTVGGRKTWRDRCGDKRFVGADLEPGDNVDAVFDICWPLEQIGAALLGSGHQTFGGIICAHLLEHVRDPFAAARNISSLLAPGGRVFVQVPWVQAFHAFPDDFWRISLSGLEVLFDGLTTLDTFHSGGSSDVAYRIMCDGRTDLSLQSREAEAELFQVLLPRPASEQLLARAGKRVHLSRGYMPVMVTNYLAEKPAG